MLNGKDVIVKIESLIDDRVEKLEQETAEATIPSPRSEREIALGLEWLAPLGNIDFVY